MDCGATFIWRYDSGLVVTGVPDSAAALTLTPAQQVDIGLACGGVPATFGQSASDVQRPGHFHAADAAPGGNGEQRS